MSDKTPPKAPSSAYARANRVAPEAAFDLTNLNYKPHRNHMGGAKVRPFAMMTPLGPSICVELVPIMTSGEERKPLILDIEGWLGLQALCAGTFLTTMQSANAQAAITEQAKAEATGMDLSYLMDVGAEVPEADDSRSPLAPMAHDAGPPPPPPAAEGMAGPSTPPLTVPDDAQGDE